jgi:hypothetical protein
MREGPGQFGADGRQIRPQKKKKEAVRRKWQTEKIPEMKKEAVRSDCKMPKQSVFVHQLYPDF